MRWTVAVVLRPVTFVLAIVAAVVVGERTDSFWYGLLAFLVGVGAGRVVGALIRGRSDRALRKAVWPAAATGFAFLFDSLGLPSWATFFVSVVAASLSRGAIEPMLPRRHRLLAVRTGRWRRVDLDELLP